MPIRALVLVLVMATAAAAQPAGPCGVCMRGDELMKQFSLEPLRAIAGELDDMQLVEPLNPTQYAKVIELRQRTPVLMKLGAIDDPDLATIAAALCQAPAGSCVEATTRSLRCLADRCDVAIPRIAPPEGDVLHVPEHCQRSRSRDKRSAPLGVGFEWGTGYHRSRYPADGRAWSFGIEARLRLGRRFGTVARIDRIAGRDAATDENDDGHDDTWTGSITRISALAGPSLVFDYARFEGAPRFLRLDLLGGYVSTRSQADESGPAAGFDLAYQLSVIRFGVRVVQGFGDAMDTSTVLAHVGIVAGSTPPRPEDDEDCSTRATRSSERRPTRLALGMDIPLIGYGISEDLGLLTTSLGLELSYHLTRKLDLLARGDLLIFPGYERERTIHSAALAGLRIDHLPKKKHDSDWSRERTGWFTTIMGGYSHGAGIRPTAAGTGPIGDVSIGWGIQDDDAAAYFRLHARFGIHPDNSEYRAIFISGGFEIRLDPRKWRDRS